MPESKMSDDDRRFLRIAYEEAKRGFDEGGCPIGSVLAEGGTLLAQGRNKRVQDGDPIAHGEMDCLRTAGRRRNYRRMTLYTSLSPCMMCAGTIVQFGIPRVVVGEAENFAGNIDAEAIRLCCRDQIAHFKVPTHIRFVEQFPMTVTGKIQKFIMREQMIAELQLREDITA